MSKGTTEVDDRRVLSTEPFPASRKVYVNGKLHPDVRVAMREIRYGEAANGHASNGNAPSQFRVYDTSGPYTEPQVEPDVKQGLTPLRLEWIRSRNDTVETEGSYHSNGASTNGTRFPDVARREVLRAKPGSNVSQMHYARQGVITPEMEYIAVRENIGREGAANGS